jgi:hypothetical protein
MRFITHRRPTPATVIACIALAVALSGTSYAALVLPANSVGSKQIKNGSIQRIDLGAKTAASLRGQRGPRGPAGSSAAFARITLTIGGATVDATRSKNFTAANVTRSGIGVACISGLPFTPKNMVATADTAQGTPSSASVLTALAPDNLGTCVGAQGLVLVIDAFGGNVDDSFYVVVE